MAERHTERGNPMIEQRPLLTVEQVAELLTCSVRHVRRELASGRLAGMRVGRLVRVDPVELARYKRSLPAVAA